MSKINSLFLYLSIFLISSILFDLSMKQTDRKLKIFLMFIATFLPSYIAAFRYCVGSDYIGYVNNYRYYSNMSIMEFIQHINIEEVANIGLYLISKIANYFNSYHVYLFLLAFLTIFPALYSFDELKLKANNFIFCFSLLTTTYVFGLNGTKQAIAINFAMLSIKYIESKKIISYLITMFFAILFHPVAVVCLPMYFLYTKKYFNITIKQLLIYIMFCIILINFDKIISLIGGHYLIYINDVSSDNNSFYLKLTILLFLFIVKKYLVHLDDVYILFINSYLLGTIINLSGFWMSQVKRAALFYFMFEPYIFSSLPHIFKKNDRILSFIIIFSYILILFIYEYYYLGHSQIFPYIFKK